MSKFSVFRDDVTEAVINAVQGVPVNPLHPVRAGMLIKSYDGYLKFTGSDGDVTFESACDYDEGSDVELVVPGRLFADVVRVLPGDVVDFICDADFVTVISGGATFRFPVVPGVYPDFPVVPESLGTVEGEDFRRIVQQVLPACSKKEANPVLRSVFLSPAGGKLRAVATDRYRLAVGEAEWSGDGAGCLVPGWTLDRFSKGVSGGSVAIGWDDRLCVLSNGPNQVVTRVTSGDFPKWENFTIVSDGSVSAEVDAEELRGALTRARLADADNATLQFTQGNLIVSAGSSNRSEDTIEIKYDSGDYQATFSIHYLLDGLAGETVTFWFTGRQDRVHLHSGSFKYTLLPRR